MRHLGQYLMIGIFVLGVYAWAQAPNTPGAVAVGLFLTLTSAIWAAAAWVGEELDTSIHKQLAALETRIAKLEIDLMKRLDALETKPQGFVQSH